MIGILERHSLLNRPYQMPRAPSGHLDPEPKPRCPYCLENFSPEILKTSKESFCPLCRHKVVFTLLSAPVHRFNRRQQWDYLANELGYILEWGRRDLDIYLFSQGEFYNPDYRGAKDRFVERCYAAQAVLRLREEFLEAEGELDHLIEGYLRKEKKVDGGLGAELLKGRTWRDKAKLLSAEEAPPRRITEFQLEMLSDLDCAVFGGLEEQKRAIRYLKARLEELDQS